MNPITVAIIDDDQLYHLHLKIKLDSISPTSKALTFINGKEGFEYLQANSSDPATLPDCILLDIEMPVMNGWDFLEKFQEIRKHFRKDIAIYIFSALGAIDQKLDEYPFLKGSLKKPFDSRQLNSLLNSLIKDKESK